MPGCMSALPDVAGSRTWPIVPRFGGALLPPTQSSPVLMNFRATTARNAAGSPSGGSVSAQTPLELLVHHEGVYESQRRVPEAKW